MRAARPTIRRFLKIVGRASLTRRLPRHPLPEGEGTHDKQVSVFEDRPEPHPAWVSGELIAVFRTLVMSEWLCTPTFCAKPFRRNKLRTLLSVEYRFCLFVRCSRRRL